MVGSHVDLLGEIRLSEVMDAILPEVQCGSQYSLILKIRIGIFIWAPGNKIG